MQTSIRSIGKGDPPGITEKDNKSDNIINHTKIYRLKVNVKVFHSLAVIGAVGDGALRVSGYSIWKAMPNHLILSWIFCWVKVNRHFLNCWSELSSNQQFSAPRSNAQTIGCSNRYQMSRAEVTVDGIKCYRFLRCTRLFNQVQRLVVAYKTVFIYTMFVKWTKPGPTDQS